MVELEWILGFLALGSFVGIVAGLFGVGGGGFMVPILTTIFLARGVPVDGVVHLALGTSMASIVFTSISSLRAHNAKKSVDWQIVKGISGGILLGVFAATFVVPYINSVYLTLFFALFIACASIQMFFNRKPQSSKQISGPKEIFFVGAGIGAVSALVSIGGGSFTVPYLIWRNIDIRRAIGTSAAVGLPISVAGTIGYVFNGWANTSMETFTVGYIYLPAAVLISIASYTCAPLGVKLAHYLPVVTLKRIFAVLLVGLSIKMMVSIF